MPGNPIKFSDLFDFTDRSALLTALDDIKSLHAAYADFKKTVIDGSLGTVAAQQRDLTAAIQELLKATEALNITNKAAQQNLLAASQQMAKYEESIRSLKDEHAALNKVNTVAKDSVDGLRNKLKELEQQYNGLSQSSANYYNEAKKLAGEIVQTKTEINTLTQALRVNISTYKAAKDSYAALDMETKKLITDLKNLEGGLGANSKKAQEMQAQIRQNTERLKEFDRQMGINNRNVGNYSSAFNGLTGSLKNSALALVSVAALTAGVKKAFQESLQFSSIERSLEVVSKTAQETNLNMQFLRQTADDLGVEFASLTNNFQKFYASATIAGYAGNETRKIFLQFANAFANIHLTTEQTNQAFLALEQIIAKGKVSAEELRRQLGNVLPGAFELAAKAAGVTTTQLDKMLRKGEILSNEFLPKFADEVAKAFGESSGHIDSLQASVNRFNNVIAQGFQSKGLRDFFKAFVDGGTSVVTFIRDLFIPAFQKSTNEFRESRREIDEMEGALSPLVARYDELKKSAVDNKEKQDELKTVINDISNILPGAATAFDKYGNALDINRQKVTDFTEANRKMSEVFRATALRDLQQNINKSLQTGQAAQAQLNANAVNQYSRSQGGFTIPAIIPAGQPGAGTLTPAGKQLKDELISAREEILKNATQIVELGGKLDQQTTQFIGQYGATRLQRLRDISELSDQINAKDQEAYNAFKSGNDKLRTGIIESIKELKRQRQELIAPGSTSEARPENPGDPNADKKAESLRKKLEREQRARIKAADDLNKAAAKEEIATAELVFARSQQTTADEIGLEEKKFAIISKYADLRLMLYAKDSDDYKSILAEKAKAEADMLERRSKAYDTAQKKIADRDKQILDSAKATIKASGEFYDAIRESERQAGIDAIRLDVAKGGRTSSQGEDDIHAITRQALQDEIDLQRDALEKMKIQDESYFDAKKALADKERQLAKENADYEIRKAEEVSEKKRQLEQAAYDFVTQLADTLFTVDYNNTEAQISNLQRKYETDIELAGDNADAKKAIDKRYQQESNKLKRQQAIIERQAAVFNIGLITAQKIVEAYPNPYLMAAAAAIGALQIAAASSKKIPDYWKGRQNGPAELANVNEKGWELIERQNKYYIAGGGKQTVAYLEAGDKVLTHEQSVKKAQENYLKSADSDAFLNSLLEGTNVTRQYEERMHSKLIQAVAGSHLTQEALAAAFTHAVTQLPLEVHNWNEDGYQRRTRRGNSFVTELNERQKIGGNG